MMSLFLVNIAIILYVVQIALMGIILAGEDALQGSFIADEGLMRKKWRGFVPFIGFFYIFVHLFNQNI